MANEQLQKHMNTAQLCLDRANEGGQGRLSWLRIMRNQITCIEFILGDEIDERTKAADDLQAQLNQPQSNKETVK